jgi:ribosomal protein L40E
MRYELYSLQCNQCGSRNAPDKGRCAGCGGVLSHIRRCSYCQAENPPNAYVCLRCYKVLREKPKVGVLHWRIPWWLSAPVLVGSMIWVIFALGHQWSSYAQAQIENNASTVQYLEMQHREMESRQDDKNKTSEVLDEQ